MVVLGRGNLPFPSRRQSKVDLGPKLGIPGTFQVVLANNLVQGMLVIGSNVFMYSGYTENGGYLGPEPRALIHASSALIAKLSHVCQELYNLGSDEAI